MDTQKKKKEQNESKSHMGLPQGKSLVDPLMLITSDGQESQGKGTERRRQPADPWGVEEQLEDAKDTGGKWEEGQGSLPVWMERRKRYLTMANLVGFMQGNSWGKIIHSFKQWIFITSNDGS